MVNSTPVLFQKFVLLIDISVSASYHEVILKKLLPLLGCLVFMLSGLAQSGTAQFAAANYIASETDGTITLELQRVGGSQGTITINIQTIDGTATIVDDYAGIPSPLTLSWSEGNTSPKTVTLPIKTDILEEGPETFTMIITSTNPDWLGTPSVATVTIIDVPPGTIQFAQADYVVNETAGTVTLELQRVGGSIGELTATIQTKDGTATIVDDYTGIPSPLTLIWSNGNTSPKTVTLPIKIDTKVEGDETFTMEIASPNVGTPSVATVTIIDVPPGTIQFAQADYVVNETAGTVTLELQRVGGSIGELTATIQTKDGTATIVDDYTGIPSPLTLIWSNGNTSPKTVTLPIKIDTKVEGDETFTMEIASPNVGTPSVATVTIIDVPPGTIQFASPTYFVNETDGTVTLEIHRVGGSIGELSASIQTFDGTATIVNDYAGIPSPLTLTWSSGNISPKSVTLPIVSDALVEGNETFTMTLSATNPDWIGTPSTTTVNIIDFDPTGPGVARLTSPSYSVAEDGGSVTLEIVRVGGDTGELTVDIQTFDGTATIDDYNGIPTPLTLSWASGNSTPKTITLPIIEDTLVEGNETFTMVISSTNADWVGIPYESTVTITDNDEGVGCEFASTVDNFQITVVGETCSGKNNGSISISATSTMDYVVSINGTSYDFTSQLSIENLAPGKYPFCIGLTGFENCEQCFEVQVEEGISLIGKTSITQGITSKSEVVVTMESGTAPFTVTINGKFIREYATMNFTIPVENKDELVVSSSVECEGNLKLQVGLFEEVVVHPNPTTSGVTVNMPMTKANQIVIGIQQLSGHLVSEKTYKVNGGQVYVPMEDIPSGLYLLKIHSSKAPQNIKIIKR